MVVNITLPWVDKRLMPNQKNGKHWASYQKAKVKARQEGALLARGFSPLSTDTGEDVSVTVTFFAPDKRGRDLDNLLSALKPALDGICEGLGLNDKRFNPICLYKAVDAKKNGFVNVCLQLGEK